MLVHVNLPPAIPIPFRSVDRLRRNHIHAEIFGRFLEESLSQSDLLFFLFVPGAQWTWLGLQARTLPGW